METSDSPNFEIDIIQQGWISSDPASVRADLCSHGDIRLLIGRQVIAPGDGSEDYTISTSALALLRTLESDHACGSSDGQLLLHCGMILMVSCPIGVDWSVAHRDGRVRLSDVVVCEETDSAREGPRFREFPGLAVELTEGEYRRAIVAFADKAKEPFADIEKIFPDDAEQQLYEEFWLEFEERLGRARA
jgi:hypothetical protein